MKKHLLLKIQAAENHSLTIAFKGNEQNTHGIGAKVIAYSKSNQITQENFVSKGYLSAIAPKIHLGLGKDSIVDSLKIIWPGGAYQTLHQLIANSIN